MSLQNRQTLGRFFEPLYQYSNDPSCSLGSPPQDPEIEVVSILIGWQLFQQNIVPT